MLKLATWNVNSIGVRLERLLAFLGRELPDIVCLQELKALDEKFPFGPIQDLGYHVNVYGQKTYNGVAVLSKTKAQTVVRGFGDAVDDPAARFIEVTLDSLTVISAYFPNGQAIGSEKYQYKLRWMERLKHYLDIKHQPTERLVLAGDFNVAPEDIDVHSPAAWKEQIMCSTPEREALTTIRNFGFADTYRQLNPDAVQYTWWDYRMLAFPKNQGLRIDHIYITEPLAAAAKVCRIDRNERKGEKPSDHVPVIAEFAL